MLIYLAVTDRDFRHQVATNGLQQAKDTIRNNMFWFGITEHYDASICLLMYQLKKIDKARCKCKPRKTSKMFNGTLVKSHHHVESRFALRVLAVTCEILWQSIS